MKETQNILKINILTKGLTKYHTVIQATRPDHWFPPFIHSTSLRDPIKDHEYCFSPDLKGSLLLCVSLYSH